MKIFILKTNLFKENSVLEKVITDFESEHQVELFDATRHNLDEKDWDNALEVLVTADRVLTI